MPKLLLVVLFFWGPFLLAQERPAEYSRLEVMTLPDLLSHPESARNLFAAGQKLGRLKVRMMRISNQGLFGNVDFQRVPSTIPESASNLFPRFYFLLFAFSLSRVHLEPLLRRSVACPAPCPTAQVVLPSASLRLGGFCLQALRNHAVS